MKSKFRASKCVEIVDFALLESPKLISRKILVIEKSWNFHTGSFSQLVWGRYSSRTDWFFKRFSLVIRIFLLSETNGHISQYTTSLLFLPWQDVTWLLKPKCQRFGRQMASRVLLTCPISPWLIRWTKRPAWAKGWTWPYLLH